jgi:ribosomal protein L7/L12
MSSDGVSNEEIAALAYELWVARGRIHGRHQEDWDQARRELAEAPGSYAVSLTAVGPNPIAILKELRDLTGLDLSKVKKWMDQLPALLTGPEGVSWSQAKQFKERLTAQGASVTVKRRAPLGST